MPSIDHVSSMLKRNSWRQTILLEYIWTDPYDVVDFFCRSYYMLGGFFGFETDFAEWFQSNYRELVYSRILKAQTQAETPDFIMERDGKPVRVELETRASDFLYHKHDIADVDEVVCVIDDKKLPVKKIVKGVLPDRLDYILERMKEEAPTLFDLYRQLRLKEQRRIMKEFFGDTDW